MLASAFRGACYVAEPLEQRLLLSVVAPGVPVWIPEGPSPQMNAGNVAGTSEATRLDVGAVGTVAVDPFNSKHLVVGTIDGGVWQTSDFTGSPSWSTTTDVLPSLAISAVAFSPLSSSVIYAGTGNQSSLGGSGVPAVGLYKSIDGGSTWTQLNPNGMFNGLRIRRIIPTTFNGGQTVFLSTDDGGAGSGGVYRSDDGGATWSRISGTNMLPDCGVSDLLQNPSNPNQFYAAVSFADSVGDRGIYKMDLGVSPTWNNVTNIISASDLNASAWIFLSMSPAGANPIWVLITNSTGYAQRVYRGVAAGITVNWTQIGPGSAGGNMPPDIFQGHQGNNLHGSLLADPTADNLVFIGGDTTSTQFRSGYVVRGNSTASGDASHPIWTSLTPIGGTLDPGTAVPTDNGVVTSPHADSRALVFGFGGVLLCACDGGIYQCTNPRSTAFAAQTWTSVNGATTGSTTGIQDMELYGTAYDNQFNVIFGAAQDAGNPIQSAAGSALYRDESGGDGGPVATDNFTRAGLGESVRYLFGSVRKWFNGPISHTPGTNDPNILRPSGLAGMFKVNPMGPTPNGLFTTSVVNAIAPTPAQLAAGQSTRVVISGTTDSATTVGAIYESNDAGSGSEFMVGPNSFVSDTWNQILPGPGFVSTSVMAYGGMSGGVANPDVLYAASGSQIFLRSTAGGMLNATAALPAGAGTILAIALDPNNWQTAFVTDGTNVYMTTNAGAAWSTITGILPASNAFKVSLAVIPGVGVNALLFSGSAGVFRMLTSAPGVWTHFGTGLPTVFIGGGIIYDRVDDVLVAGTFGRGFWEIPSASTFAFTVPQIQITGSPSTDTYVIRRYFNSVQIDESLSGGPTTSFSFDSLGFANIQINTLDGNDTVTIDTSNGNPLPFGGVTYDGGNNLTGGTHDSLILTTGGEADMAFLNLPNLNFSDTTNGTLTTGTINYSAVETIVLDGGDGDDQFNINATTATDVQVLGGTGSDLTYFAPGSRDVSSLNAHVDVDGETGANDRVMLQDSLSTVASNWSLSGSELNRGTFSLLHYQHVDRLTMTLDSAGPHTFSVTGGAPITTINGGTQAETFEVDGTPFADVTLNGDTPTAPASPGDTLVIEGFFLATVAVMDNGFGDGTVHFSSPLPSTQTYTGIESFEYRDLVDLSHILQDLALQDAQARLQMINDQARIAFFGNNPFPPIGFSNVSHFTLDTSFTGANDTLSIDKTFTAPPWLTDFTFASGAGNDTLNVEQTSFTLASDAGLFSKSLTINLIDGATLIMGATQHLAALNILAGIAKLLPGGDKTLVTQLLSLDTGARLDLNDDAIIVDYSDMNNSPFQTIKSLLSSGFAGGFWTGDGINSTVAATVASDGSNPHKTALGFAEASKIGMTTLNGQPVDMTSVVVRYATSGDANLNHAVNALDFNAVATNFGGQPFSWGDADFNFDNKVDTKDFNSLAINFNQMMLPAPVLTNPLSVPAQPVAVQPIANLFSDSHIARTAPEADLLA